MTLTTSSPVSLYSLLGDHPGTEALKTGRVSSPLVTFDFADVLAQLRSAPAYKPEPQKSTGSRRQTGTAGPPQVAPAPVLQAPAPQPVGLRGMKPKVSKPGPSIGFQVCPWSSE